MEETSGCSILRVTPNPPLAPIQPEIDPDDNLSDFILWSSDSSSESSDNEDNKMDIDEEANTKTTTIDIGTNITETLLAEKSANEANMPWSGFPAATTISPNCSTDTTVMKPEPFFEFIGEPRTTHFEPFKRISPIDCYKLFVDDSIIENMVVETNKNAASYFIRSNYHKEFLSGWMDVNFNEMRSFIGLLIFMSCKKLPYIKSFWSADRDLSSPIAGHVMTETRFKRILHYWHFGVGRDDGFAKINNLLDPVNENCKKHKTPDRVLYAGMFTTYLREKYITAVEKKGQRLLRLIDRSGYSYKTMLMPAYDEETKFLVTRDALFELVKDYLDEGRLLIVHHEFQHLTEEFAVELLKRQTHIVGPIRRINKTVSGTSAGMKVKKSQDHEGVTIFKWKYDNMKGYGMSTYGTKLVAQAKVSELHESRLVIKQTPEYLTDFLGSLDVFEITSKYFCDQHPSTYETTWYRRFAVDFLTGPCVSNAYLLYKQTEAGKTCTYFKFQNYLWKQLFGFSWLVKDDAVSMEESQ